MKRPSFRSLFTTCLCLLALACSSTATGPEQAVQEFYAHLNEGAYASAMSMYGDEARGIFEDPETGGTSVFDEWAQTESKGGKIRGVEILQQETTGDRASVEFEIRYADGTRVGRSVTLTREGGEWKLGLIS